MSAEASAPAWRLLDGGVAHVEIGHAPLNLLTQDVRRTLGDSFLAAATDPRVRALVFGSAGQSFCAGADLKEFPLRFDPAVARRHGENGHRMTLALARLPKPVVAMVDGYCMGGGLELAMACGYRIASEDARLALPEIRRGVWPGTGGIFLLRRLVGPSRARRLLLTGETLSAGEALAVGLVDEVVPGAQLQARAQALAGEMAAGPASSVQTVAALLDGRELEDFAEHLSHELEAFVQAYQLPAAREGIAAFFEKRPARW